MEKSLDSHGRWRNKIVAFRVSEEEARIIDDKVALSGLTKQEYIIRRLCEKKIVVNGNPKVYIALKNRLIISELEEKLSKMSRHEDYTKSKMAPTKEEREEYRQKYLDTVGMHRDFRW